MHTMASRAKALKKGDKAGEMTPQAKRTKQKLARMMDQFDDFEGVMKAGTRVRQYVHSYAAKVVLH